MTETAAATSSRPASPADTRGLVSWALYDWANSPFTTLIVTFVFAAYFSKGVVGDDVEGQALWGYLTGSSAFVVAVLSPIVGAIADAGGARKRWLFAFTLICIVATALLWFVLPNRDALVLAAVLVVLATVGFEFGGVFCNAMLGDLAEPERIGRWSGWAWGVGYLGGLAALVVMLVGFVQPETPWFGVGKEDAANIRAVGPLVAIWFAVFALPLFLFTPDRPAVVIPLGARISGGFTRLGRTFSNLRAHANVGRFLIARMIYNDGLGTVFAMGGVYAAGRFAMTTAELIQFGIVLNVTAGAGAFGFAWLDDRKGSKRAIAIALVGLSISGIGAVWAPTKEWLYIWAGVLGIFVGPAQAASRTLMTRLTPPERRTEFFGLFALSGKATAFLGPMLAGVVTMVTESPAMGLGSAVVFFLVGLVLLIGVREPRAG